MKRCFRGIMAVLLVLPTQAGFSDDTAKVDSINSRVAALYRPGNYRVAIALGQQAVALAEKEYGPEAEETSIPLNNLAMLYETTGRYAEAEPLLQRSLAILEKCCRLGEGNP